MKTLKFHTKKSRTLHILSFNTDSTSPNEWEDIVLLNENSKAIQEKVLAMEKLNEKIDPGKKRIIYAYFVSEQEIMTDNRSIFGHENQQSVKELGRVIPMTYLRGNKITICELMIKHLNGELSPAVKESFIRTLKEDLNLQPEDLTIKDSLLSLVMIPGEGKKETFFDPCNEHTKFIYK